MIVLDYRDKRPLYEQVAEKLENLIIRGALEPNSKLPGVRSLALELSVNPNTIQRAYAQLEQEGYIYTVVGRGNYVTSEQEWKRGRFSKIDAKLEELFVQAKEAGIPKERIRKLLEKYYEEVKEDD